MRFTLDKSKLSEVAGTHLYGPDTGLYGVYPIRWPFTVDTTGSIDPAVTATFLDAEAVWRKPDGSRFTGKTPSSTLFDVTGEYTFVFPRGMTVFAFSNDLVSGDISGWILPDTLESIYLHLTSLSGDISGLLLPDSLNYFNVRSTSISGDISKWTIPPSMEFLYCHESSVSYGSSGAFANTDLADDFAVTLQDNGLSQTQVDNVLIDLDASGAIDGIVNVSGTNAAPSAAGLAAKTSLEAKDWTVTVST